MKKRNLPTANKSVAPYTKIWPKIYDWVEKYRWLLVILAATAILRLPSLFEPNRYADEDIYLTLGMAIRRGLVLYKNIHDNKPPLLYMMAAIAGNVTYFRLILLGWNLINIVLVWKIAKKIISREWAVILSTIFFAFFSSIPLTEGNIANGEIFMIMPTCGAILLLLSTKVKDEQLVKKYFGAGFLLSIAFLFKVPVVAEALMVGIWMIFHFWAGKKTPWQTLFKACLALALGFIIPIIFSIIYYYFRGAGPIYIQTAFLQNLGYVSSWEGGAKPAFYQSGLFQRGIILLLGVTIFTLLRPKIGEHFYLVALWFLGALFGALLSGRPYPHYMVEILPPLSLLLGLGLTGKLLQKSLNLVPIGLLALSLFYYHFWYYPSLPYYLNFIQYVTGQKSTTEYERFWGDSVLRNYEVARYITEHTNPNDRIFVWGTEPAIYAISRRLPVGRFTVAYHIADFRAYDETMTNIRRDPPKYIVLLTNEGTPFPELVTYTKATSVLVEQVGEAQVYKVL